VLPLTAVAAAPLLAALAGLSQRSLLGTPLEPYAYGFFLDRYPLFTLAILYGLARLAVVAGAAPGRLRLVTAPIAAAALLAACLLPTFGGVVARAGFFSGGMSFLQGQTVTGGYAVGTAMAALAYGAVLGLGVALIRRRVAFSRRALLDALLALVALWWAALAIAAPRALGLPVAEGFPAAPLDAAGALQAAGLALLAFGPHALLVSRRTTFAALPTPGNGQTIPLQRAG
jgi:hypothetical protein